MEGELIQDGAAAAASMDEGRSAPQAQDGIAEDAGALDSAVQDDAAPRVQDGIAEGGKAEAGNPGETKQPEAPEPYELTAAEDFPIPQEQLSSFTETCRGAGLTKAQAEAVLNWHRAQYQEDTAWRQQQERETRQAWDKEILEDREFGGTVRNYRETVAAARRALDAIDTDGALRKLLKDTQGQFHPAVVRSLARAGRMMGEHRFVGSSGAGSTGAGRPLWERVYGPAEDSNH